MKKNQRFWSIRFKMMAVFLPIILISAISVTLVNYLDTKREITNQIEQKIAHRLDALTLQMENEFMAHESIAKGIGAFYGAKGNKLSKQDYKEVIEQMLPLNTNTLGSGIWLEPYTYSSAEEYFGPYLYKDGDNIIYTEEYESKDYDYPTTDWYQLGKANGKEIGWTDPYYDEASGITMITAATPFNVGGKFAGVVSADYDLSTIGKMIEEVVFEKTGYAILLNEKGQYIAHQDTSKIMQESILEDEQLHQLGQEIANKDKGSMSLRVNGVRMNAYYTALPTTGWRLVAMAPEAELYSALKPLVYKAALVTGLVTFIAGVLIYLFSLQITKGFKTFVKQFKFLAEGDFTQFVQVNSNDEMGQMASDYNKVLQTLQTTMTMISENAEGVASAAEELAVSTDETSKAIEEVAGATQSLAVRTSEQSDYMKNMNHSTKDIFNQMSRMGDAIGQVKESASYTTALAKEGNEQVNEVTIQMRQVNEQIKQASHTVTDLDAKSRKIEEIITMITSIAEQTNLLALNAAIEAARAGEHGRGFAVVASEVRTLADASSKSASDIRLLIEEIQKGVSESVQVMQVSRQKAKSGTEVIENTKGTFEKILSSAEEVNKQAENVHGLAEGTLRGVQDIRKVADALTAIAVANDENTQNMSAATEQQTAIIEQIKDASDALAQMALNLQHEMAVFKI